MADRSRSMKSSRQTVVSVLTAGYRPAFVTNRNLAACFFCIHSTFLESHSGQSHADSQGVPEHLWYGAHCASFALEFKHTPAGSEASSPRAKSFRCGAVVLIRAASP